MGFDRSFVLCPPSTSSRSANINLSENTEGWGSGGSYAQLHWVICPGILFGAIFGWLAVL